MPKLSRLWLKASIVGLLCLVTIVIFWPLTRFSFIDFDDPAYVTNEPRIAEGLSFQNLVWAFVSPHPAENWQPITTISYLLDVQVFGPKPFGHHLGNIGIHVANTILLLLILYRLTGFFWASAVIGGLFALHPMHVEPVAWISSRKDVLSTFFFLLSLWSYVCYAGKSAEAKERHRWRKWLYYLAALACFGCALMSKATAVTLPFLLLLIDYWPLGRLKISASLPTQFRSSWPLIREKLPFFVLSAVFLWLGWYLLRKEGGTENYGELALSNRIANGIVSYARYLGKAVWPMNLSAFYPRPPSWPTWQVTMSLLLLLGCTALTIRYARKRPYLFVGWFWFLGTLLPVVGVVQLGAHSIADRYTYIPYTGLFIALCYSAIEICSRIRFGAPPMSAMSVIALGLLAVMTNVQINYWQNSETLFQHALVIDENNAAARNLLGKTLLEQGRLKEAEQNFVEALRIRPDFPYAEINYATALARDGRIEEGLAKLSELLKRRPNDEEAHYSLGLLLQQKGDIAAAIEHYQEALRLKADDADALNNLAWIRAANANAAVRDGQQAVRLAARACELTRFQNPVMIGTFAAAYAEAGQFTEAVATAEKAQAVAKELGQAEIAERNSELLKFYQAGRAYHETE